MISLARGQKTKLADLTAALQLQVALRFNAPQLAFDFSCFGLDEEGKLSDDRYFIFYNQTESPERALRLTSSTPHEAQFALDLSRLPASVNRLVFVATVDGTGAMSAIESGEFSLGDGKATVAQFALEGALFGTEKAIMVAEIYRKGEWRLAANG
ncbi:stress protein, partial [bacterium]